MRSTSNEIGRLAQGIKCGVKGTNTIKFIRREYVPAGRKATYAYFVVDIKAHKEENECTRLKVGGDQIEYPGDKSTRTAGLTTAKMLFNSTISTPGARFLVIDIKNFYLNIPPRKVRVNGCPDVIPPTGSNRRIRTRLSRGRRQGIHRNPERHVQLATSWHPCERTVTMTISSNRVPTH
jgi:hypothetical protein